MALYKASGAAADSLNLVANMATGITDFFGGTTGIDYEEIKTFAASGIGDLEPKITANALALSTFSTAMKDMAVIRLLLSWTNIRTNILGGIGALLWRYCRRKSNEELWCNRRIYSNRIRPR